MRSVKIQLMISMFFTKPHVIMSIRNLESFGTVRVELGG